MERSPSETALIIVDMQKCFCKPGGSLYSERSEKVISSIQAFLERARNKDVKIIYTKDSHREQNPKKHYDEFERWGAHCIKGREEWSIVSELAPHEEDIVIEKTTYDAFYKTEMDSVLQSHNIESVLVTGVLTNVCVLHTASSAALHDYQSIVLSDCTDALNDEHKEYALTHIEFLFGEVLESEEITFNTSK